MARRVDRDRVHQAKITGAAARLRDLVITQPDAYSDLRTAWPGIAERIDRLTELVAWDESAAD
jgi:hypothetical protein